MEIKVRLRNDWDLVDDYGGLIAWWDQEDQCIRTILIDEYGHLDFTPATEAHGLMLLHSIKQQLENSNE